eukprot:2209773-Amphidinium_carterae.1
MRLPLGTFDWRLGILEGLAGSTVGRGSAGQLRAPEAEEIEEDINPEEEDEEDATFQGDICLLE